MKIVKLIILVLVMMPLQIQAKVFTVNGWVQMYLRTCDNDRPKMTCRDNLNRSLSRMKAYQDMTFKYLDRYGLPRWLVILPIVESSYIPGEISKKGALGLFQLMPFNVKEYKTINIRVDGKNIKIVPTKEEIEEYGLDPEASLQMGALHLSLLFQKYQGHKDQEKLALLAYNGGAGRVNRWLRGKGGLYDETINFYNKLIAIRYIIDNDLI